MDIKERHLCPYTSEQYEYALNQLRKRSEKQFKGQMHILQIQYAMPEHTITAGKLAQKLGYANFGAANLRYGTLGRKISEILGGEAPDCYKDGSPAYFSYLSQGEGHASGYRWIMYKELVQALEKMGLVATSEVVEEDADFDKMLEKDFWEHAHKRDASDDEN
jgi:predicted HNH restriction endonuclease